MGKLLNDSSSMMCPHGGAVQAITSNTRAKGSGGFLLRSTDTFVIAGCSLTISNSPHPCVQVQWVETALKSTVMSNPTLTDESVGLCVAADQAVQGTVQITSTQAKVSGD
jgi:hypothetical protein